MIDFDAFVRECDPARWRVAAKMLGTAGRAPWLFGFPADRDLAKALRGLDVPPGRYLVSVFGACSSLSVRMTQEKDRLGFQPRERAPRGYVDVVPLEPRVPAGPADVTVPEHSANYAKREAERKKWEADQARSDLERLKLERDMKALARGEAPQPTPQQIAETVAASIAKSGSGDATLALVLQALIAQQTAMMQAQQQLHARLLEEARDREARVLELLSARESAPAAPASVFGGLEAQLGTVARVLELARTVAGGAPERSESAEVIDLVRSIMRDRPAPPAAAPVASVQTARGQAAPVAMARRVLAFTSRVVAELEAETDPERVADDLVDDFGLLPGRLRRTLETAPSLEAVAGALGEWLPATALGDVAQAFHRPGARDWLERMLAALIADGDEQEQEPEPVQHESNGADHDSE